MFIVGHGCSYVEISESHLQMKFISSTLMSEDVHSSTFPRLTDICANQVAPFLSRSRVFEKLKK